MITFRNWQLKDQCIRLSVLKTFKWLKKFNSDLKITELRASQGEKWRGHWLFFWKPWMCAKSRRGNFYESAIFLGKSAKSELQTTILTEFRIPFNHQKKRRPTRDGFLETHLVSTLIPPRDWSKCAVISSECCWWLVRTIEKLQE